MRLAEPSSGAGDRPDRTASTSATIDTAVSAGVRAPRSSPVGPWYDAISSSVTPARAEPGPPLGLGVSRPEAADVADPSPERGGEHRGGQVVVVIDHDDQIARRQPGHRGERLVLRRHDPSRPAQQLHLRDEGVAER